MPQQGSGTVVEPSAEGIDGRLIGIRECPKCRETLRIVETRDGPAAVEQASMKEHVCWDLPQDANLLVLE